MDEAREIMPVRESDRTLTLWLKRRFALGPDAIPWRTRSWIPTDWRLVRHTGIVNIQERPIPPRHIQDVNYKASLLGRLLGYGNLAVASAGQDNVGVRVVVGRAGQFQQAIFDTMESHAGLAHVGSPR